MGRRRRGDFGAVRKHRTSGYYIDVRPHGRIWGLDGVGFAANRELAQGLLNMMRTRILDGATPIEAVAPYLHARSAANRLAARYDHWLTLKERQVEVGDLSPGTVREYRRYARPGGEIEWWGDRSVFDATTADLEEWSLWLATERGLSPKTRRHVLGALRACFGWLRRKRILRELPDWPGIEVPEHRPVILDAATQARVLAAVPERARGALLVAALMAMRPGEVRALDASDYAPAREGELGRLSVTKGMQGLQQGAKVGPTKNRRNRELPVPRLISEWIETHVPRETRLQAGPLFVNPNTGRRWSHWALRQAWVRACTAAGLGHVPLYEGTKHSGATDMLARTKDLEAVRVYLGHQDARSTRRYAQIRSLALVRIASRGDRDSGGIVSVDADKTGSSDATD
ncbi:MAG TPA: site-specific integrase [Candidatus Krumholzibacteria bacterium]